MQKVTIEFETSNEMFDDHPGEACAWVLETLANRFRNASGGMGEDILDMATKVSDDNGNYIGDVTLG